MDKNIAVIEYKQNDFYFLYLKKQADKGLTAHGWHNHSFYEIMLIGEGESEYVIENREYEFKKGEIILIKPWCRHFESKVIKTPTALFCLGFPADMIENGRTARELFDRGEHFYIGIDSPLFQLMSAAKDKFHSNKEAQPIFIKAIAEAAIAILSDVNISGENGARVKNRQIGKILSFINRNLTDIKSSEDIEAATFFSSSYLRALFKREMGIGVMEYVRNKKVLLAHSKIKDGAKPTEIYLDCGFSNYPTFYRAYVAYFGYSPKGKKE